MKKIKRVLGIVFWLVLGGLFYGVGIDLIEHTTVRDFTDYIENIFGVVSLGISSLSITKAFSDE